MKIIVVPFVVRSSISLADSSEDEDDDDEDDDDDDCCCCDGNEEHGDDGQFSFTEDDDDNACVEDVDDLFAFGVDREAKVSSLSLCRST